MELPMKSPAPVELHLCVVNSKLIATSAYWISARVGFLSNLWVATWGPCTHSNWHNGDARGRLPHYAFVSRVTTLGGIVKRHRKSVVALIQGHADSVHVHHFEWLETPAIGFEAGLFFHAPVPRPVSGAGAYLPADFCEDKKVLSIPHSDICVAPPPYVPAANDQCVLRNLYVLRHLSSFQAASGMGICITRI